MGELVTNDPRGNLRVNSGRPAGAHAHLTPGQRKLIDGALNEGTLSVNEIALAAGTSSRTIVRIRAQRKALQDVNDND